MRGMCVKKNTEGSNRKEDCVTIMKNSDAKE